MKIIRRKAKIIKIGNIRIGGNNPIAIQSMTKTKTADIESTVRQIKELEKLSCEIVRMAVKDNADAKALKEIRKEIKTPLVADIHFNWLFAMEAIESGIDKIRLNPGNIYKKDQVSQIAKAAKLAGIPIRVGLNSGSLPNSSFQKAKPKNTAGIMAKNALDYIRILEKCGFYDIVVSLKASNTLDTIEAYRLMSKLCDYPFHLGVTASGLTYLGAIKSSIGIGSLLLQGIGDTIRISLTDEPREEVKVAKLILETVGLRGFGPEIISCPTCGRCEVDLVGVVKELESKLSAMNQGLSTRPLKVAVMGCVVNGPGEAAQADIGVAFGRRDGFLFKKGKPMRKINFNNCVKILLKELERINVG